MISGVDIVSLEPYTLEDVYDNMRSIAAALGVPGRGEGVVRQVIVVETPESTGHHSRLSQHSGSQTPRKSTA